MCAGNWLCSFSVSFGDEELLSPCPARLRFPQCCSCRTGCSLLHHRPVQSQTIAVTVPGSGPTILNAPVMSSSGESLRCRGSALLRLVPCWEILQKARIQGALGCLGWVPTLALVPPALPGGNEVRCLGREGLYGRGEPFGGSFHVESVAYFWCAELLALSEQGQGEQPKEPLLGWCVSKQSFELSQWRTEVASTPGTQEARPLPGVSVG